MDLRLLHALQVEPRASWATLSPVLGVDAATLSRRWRRLQDEGIAWVTGLVGDLGRWGSALIELECDPQRIEAVADQLAQDREVVVLDHTAGGRDLLATVAIESQQMLSRFTTGRLAALPGIRSVRTHVVVDQMVEGGAWRLRELSRADVARIPSPAPPRPRAPGTVSTAVRSILEYELSCDGRATAAAIGRAYDIAPQRITDAIATLRASGELSIRTDVARRFSRWPTYVWYFVEVPAAAVASLRTALRSVPEVRLATLCASRYNLILAVWLRDLADINAFEVALERAVAGVRIADRSIVMRIGKHLGRILDDDGLATGNLVPIGRAPSTA